MDKETWGMYLAKVVDADTLHIHKANHDILDLFSHHIPANLYPRVLDMASGIGIDVFELKNRGYDAQGLELNPVAIEYAKKFFKVKLHHGDIHETPFRSNAFDAILTIQAFEHALSPYIVLSEMNRIIRMGGRVFIDTCDADDNAMWTPQHPSLLYPRQIYKLAEHLGFTLVKDISRRHRTQIILEKCEEVNIHG